MRLVILMSLVLVAAFGVGGHREEPGKVPAWRLSLEDNSDQTCPGTHGMPGQSAIPDAWVHPYLSRQFKVVGIVLFDFLTQTGQKRS